MYYTILTNHKSFELSVQSGLPRKRWETQHFCLSHPETTQVINTMLYNKAQKWQEECHHHEIRSTTHSVKISKVFIHFCVAEDGVTLTHSPQHALKGLNLYPLDKTWNKPITRRDQIRFEIYSLIKVAPYTPLYVAVKDIYSSSPQLGSKSLHTSASCDRVCLHSGEFFILGTKSFMLIIKRNMFHSWNIT